MSESFKFPECNINFRECVINHCLNFKHTYPESSEIDICNFVSGKWETKKVCSPCLSKLKFYGEKGAYSITSQCCCCNFTGVIFMNPQDDKVCIDCYNKRQQKLV